MKTFFYRISQIFDNILQGSNLGITANVDLPATIGCENAILVVLGAVF